MDTPLTTNHNHRQFTVISGLHPQRELWHSQMIVGWLRTNMRGVFTGHLVARNPPVGGAFLAARWTWQGEVWSRRCMRGLRGGRTRNEDHQSHREAQHTSLSGLTLKSRDFTRHPYRRLCVLITRGSARSFHIISAQAAEYLRCRNSLKSRCEVSDGPAVQLRGWRGWDAEAGVRTRPPTVWGDGTHILLQVCHKQCRCSVRLFLPLITHSSIQPSLIRVNIVSSNSTRVESGAAWHCLSQSDLNVCKDPLAWIHEFPPSPQTSQWDDIRLLNHFSGLEQSFINTKSPWSKNS